MEEILKWIPGFEGKYKVSSLGYVLRVDYVYYREDGVKQTKKQKKLGGSKLTPKGYMRVRLDGKTKFIHQIIAENFIPNPNNLPQINHIDGNKLNNNSNNLEWVTNQENRDHAVKNRLIAYGETAGLTKLTLNQVKEIKYLYSQGNLSQREIAKMFNIGQQNVSMIIRNKTWNLALKD